MRGRVGGSWVDNVVETVWVEEATDNWETSSMLSKEHSPESRLGISGPPAPSTLLLLTVFSPSAPALLTESSFFSDEFLSVSFSLLRELGVITPFIAGFLCFSVPFSANFLGIFALLNRDRFSVSSSPDSFLLVATRASLRAFRMVMGGGFLTLRFMVTTVTFAPEAVPVSL